MVKETEFYDRLGLSPDATAADIKKAYRKKAMELHPDKNRDNPAASDKFKEVGEAYEVLSNDEKRQLYDKFGKAGLEGQGHASAEDIFSAFFGGGNPFGFGGSGGGRRGPVKGEDIAYQIPVTLEDFYNGKTTKMAVTRNIICSTCEGKGAKNADSVKKCSACKGQGIRLVTRQIGPGMIQQMQVACPDCEGRGETIVEKDRCQKCKGKKVAKDKKILEVHIEKGMKDNQKVVFRGESDQAPGIEPGDIVFILREKEHKVFTRKGADLFIKKSISLIEALGGTHFHIRHLDDRYLDVSSDAGDIIKPNEERTIVGEGMPIYKNSMEKGNLHIQFDIVFPDSLDEEMVNSLKALLPNRPKLAALPKEAIVDEVKLSTRINTSGSSHRQAYDSDDDDDEGSHAGGVPCRQS